MGEHLRTRGRASTDWLESWSAQVLRGPCELARALGDYNRVARLASEMNDPAETWIRSASTGDAGAVEHLLVRYLPDLVEYLERRSARWLRQRESAADLAQSVCREVLARVRDGRFAFQGEPQFRQWLFRAAVIKLVERARHGSADKRDPARETRDPEVLAGLESFDSPSQLAALHEELERFQAAFASLSIPTQELISLKLVDGLTHREIAARRGISETNSRVQLARAQAQLAHRGGGA